ncbi:MAG: ABC-type Na+ transport system, ATPase component [Acetothermia bacterium 64_32]|nr:MAG: ABC-type Na+ transport system, ATPase component [Acetothermia bacterium 64_32]MBC7097558.1 ABC transporter ATP-binding protein [Candidatus Bipolaricaulota bacterium]HAF71123.1 ABC transporter ATP-binding protein [Candidatus Acetothermia bacterium]
MKAVSARGLTKVFRGRRGQVRAVDGVSFTVEQGEIFGLLGPNGAGKTTTLRMLATLISPTEGTAEVMGYDILSAPQKVRARIGFLTTETGLYERLTPWETLLFFGRIFGYGPGEVEARAEATLRVLGLEGLKHRRVGTLSAGERQKLSLGRCLIHDPPVLILDEPTASLDVFVARTVTELIRRLRAEGHTILLSTHDLHLAERLCDRLGIIHRGRLVAVGSPEELGEEVGGVDFEEVFFRTLRRAGLSPMGANPVPGRAGEA